MPTISSSERSRQMPTSTSGADPQPHAGARKMVGRAIELAVGQHARPRRPLPTASGVPAACASNRAVEAAPARIARPP